MPDEIIVTILGPEQLDNNLLTDLLIGAQRNSLPRPIGEYQLARINTNKRNINLNIWTLADTNQSKMAIEKYCQESDILIFVYNPFFDKKFKRFIKNNKQILENVAKPTVLIVKDNTIAPLQEKNIKKLERIFDFLPSLHIFKFIENNANNLRTSLTNFAITQKFADTPSEDDFIITPSIKPLLTADKDKIIYPFAKFTPAQLQNLTYEQAYSFLQTLQEEIFNKKWQLGLFGGEFVYLKDNENPGIIVPKTIKAILDKIDDAAQNKQTYQDATIEVMKLVSDSIYRIGTFFNRRHLETQNFYAEIIPTLLQNHVTTSVSSQPEIDRTPHKSHKFT